MLPVAFFITICLAASGEPPELNPTISPMDLRRIDANVGDVSPLSAQGRNFGNDLRPPTSFEHVFQIPFSADSRYAGYFVRGAGGVYAIFKQSEYAELMRKGRDLGTVALVPAGTTYFIGGIPGSLLTAQSGEGDTDRRDLASLPISMSVDTFLPGTGEPSASTYIPTIRITSIVDTPPLPAPVSPPTPVDPAALAAAQSAAQTEVENARLTATVSLLFHDDALRDQRIGRLLSLSLHGQSPLAAPEPKPAQPPTKAPTAAPEKRSDARKPAPSKRPDIADAAAPEPRR